MKEPDPNELSAPLRSRSPAAPRPPADEVAEPVVLPAQLSPTTAQAWLSGYAAAARVEREERSSPGTAERATALAWAWMEELDALGWSRNPLSAERERGAAAVRETWATLRRRMLR